MVQNCFLKRHFPGLLCTHYLEDVRPEDDDVQPQIALMSKQDDDEQQRKVSLWGAAVV